jgi:hypothetical protein
MVTADAAACSSTRRHRLPTHPAALAADLDGAGLRPRARLRDPSTKLGRAVALTHESDNQDTANLLPA